MSYLGNNPNKGSFFQQKFTGDGSTTAFTLLQSVTDGSQLIITIGNVIQEEGNGKAYTASGTTLTFDSAPANNDVIVVRYLGRSLDTPTTYATQITYKYVATNAQTAFSGSDANGNTLSYTIGSVDVYLNGVHLDTTDFTETNESTITLASGATTNDELVIVAKRTITLTDVVPKSAGGTFAGDVIAGGALTVNGAFTSQGIDDNADATAITITSAERVGIGATTVDRQLHLEADNSTTYSSSDFDQAYNLLKIENNNTTNNVATGLQFLVGTNGSASITTTRTGDGEASLCFGTRGGGSRAERMRITSDGKVGIGDTSPDATLDVHGNVVFGDGGGFDMNINGTRHQFSIAGTERMRIDNSGNVMIGETTTVNSGFLTLATSANPNPLSMLCRSTTDSHECGIIFQKSSTDSGNFAQTADDEALGSIKFRGVDTSGVSRLGASIACQQNGTSSSSVPADLIFRTTGTERMRIHSNGNVSMQNTDNQALLKIFGHLQSFNGLMIQNGTNNTGGLFVSFRKFDNITIGSISHSGSGSSVAFNTTSDYRLKENVSYDFDATSRLKKLKPARFNWIADKDNTVVDGFLAHEVSDIVPEAITGTKDDTQNIGTVKDKDGNIIDTNISEAQYAEGKKETVDSDGNKKESLYPSTHTWEKTASENVYQQIDQAKLIPLLVKTIQELEARITTLEGK